MAGRGGSAPARKGAAFERRVVEHQRRQGRVAYRLRQGQGNAVDVVSIEHCQDSSCSVFGERVAHVFLIQCRDHSDGRVGVSGAERLAMLGEAGVSGATPLLAWPENGGISYRELGAERRAETRS